MAVNSQKNKNIARKKAVSKSESISAANRQIWQREFNADYDQVVLRFSSAVFAGLNQGQPPPRSVT